MLHCKLQPLATLITLLIVGCIPALANSTSYTLSGTLTSLSGLSHQQVSGSVIWDSIRGATSSTFNLSNTAGPAFCSSSCTLLADTFIGTGSFAGDKEYLYGVLGPGTSKLVLTIFNRSGRLVATYKGNVTWAVPESGSPFELVIVLVVLAIVGFKSPLQKQSHLPGAVPLSS
jgi:hypothetical protein